MTKIINFVGGPGTGKTAMCCWLFAELKMRGKKVEYIPEVAKNLVWTKEFNLLNNQHYVSMKQYELFKAVIDKVDYVVTDGPLLHGIYYNRHNEDNFCDVQKVENMIVSMLSEFDHVYIHVIKGDFVYEKVGRLQTEEESRKISDEIARILESFSIPYTTIRSGRNALENILDCIKDDVSDEDHPDVLKEVDGFVP